MTGLFKSATSILPMTSPTRLLMKEDKPAPPPNAEAEAQRKRLQQATAAATLTQDAAAPGKTTLGA